MNIKKVISTDAAETLIRKLQAENGNLMFHLSGGCCDGSAPMCFVSGDFIIGDADVLIDEVCGCPFYMSKDQYEYWKHTQLILDVTRGRGSSFSIEIPLGVRFLIRSRIFNEQELKMLGFL